jgi:hypothetical protein
MERSIATAERVKLRRTIDDLLLNSNFDIDPHDLPQYKIRKGFEQRFLEAHAALCREGCNPHTLLWAIRLGLSGRGKSIPALPPAREVNKILARIESLADDLEAIEKNSFLELLKLREIQKICSEKNIDIEEVDDLGEVLPHLYLPRWMRAKAEIYREWLKIASKRTLPKSNPMLTRLDSLFPALYVKDATGRGCISLLEQLLEAVGIQVDGSQLSRDMKILRSDYMWLKNTMRSMLLIVKDRKSS